MISKYDSVSDYHYIKARILIEMEQYIEAKHELINAITQYQKVIYWFSLGTINHKLKLYHICLNNYVTALSLSRDNPEIYFKLGLIYEELAEYSEAMNYYNIVFRLNSNFTEASKRMQLLSAGNYSVKIPKFDHLHYQIDDTMIPHKSYLGNANIQEVIKSLCPDDPAIIFKNLGKAPISTACKLNQQKSNATRRSVRIANRNNGDGLTYTKKKVRKIRKNNSHKNSINELLKTKKIENRTDPEILKSIYSSCIVPPQRSDTSFISPSINMELPLTPQVLLNQRTFINSTPYPMIQQSCQNLMSFVPFDGFISNIPQVNSIPSFLNMVIPIPYNPIPEYIKPIELCQQSIIKDSLINEEIKDIKKQEGIINNNEGEKDIKCHEIVSEVIAIKNDKKDENISVKDFNNKEPTIT